MEKVPYRPKEGKRFQVAHDPVSQERVRSVKTAIEAFDSMFPELKIGCTIFGSLSKGKILDQKSAGATDVDIFVLYDTAPLMNKDEKSIFDKQKIEELLIRGGATEDVLFSFYIEHLRKKHNFKMGTIAVDFAFASFPHLTKIELLELYIQKTIADIVKEDIRIDIFLQKINSHEDKPYAHLIKDVHNLTRTPGRFLFGLDVGGKMRRHARAMLSELSLMDRDTARHVWQRIRRASILGERVFFNVRQYNFFEALSKFTTNSIGLFADKKLLTRYPRTFEEACAKFGVPLKEYLK